MINPPKPPIIRPMAGKMVFSKGPLFSTMIFPKNNPIIPVINGMV